MEAKALVGGKSANFALFSAAVVSGVIGFWGAYSAASGYMDWDSPGTMQQVAKQLLHDKAKTEISHDVAPVISPQEVSKTMEMQGAQSVYIYPNANVATPPDVFKPESDDKEPEQQKPEPKRVMREEQREPERSFVREEREQKRVVREDETLVSEKPKQTSNHATEPAKEKPEATAKSGGWIDDLMPGEPAKTSLIEYEYVADGNKHRINGGEWKSGEGKIGSSSDEIIAAITPDIKKAVVKGGGHVETPEKFKSDSGLWSDK